MLSDLKFALRQLVKAPSFTIVALLTLALGLGSATVVFSAVNALMLKPLPLIAHPEDRLVYLSETSTPLAPSGRGWNYPDYQDLRARMTGLAGMWIHSDLTVILTGKNQPRRLWGTEITWDAFALMGVAPVQGRPFNADDAKPGAPDVALISHELWQSQFGGDEAIVGSVLTLQGKPTEVIGVMPPLWRYPDFTEIWIPMRPEGPKMMGRGYFAFTGRGLLKPGVTLEDAQLEASTIMAALEKEHPASNAGVGVTVRPMREATSEDIAHLTLLLFCAVLFVFLIACVNVANLLLARAVTRAKEISIRLALGAERQRVVRQLVTENLLLALCGGVLGLILALWANDAIIALIPSTAKPFWLQFTFDGRVFLFVLVLASLSALLFGLIPALKASRPDLVTELKEGGRAAESGGGIRATRLRNLLVIVEVALALVLLVGAGLMMRSFLHLRNVHPGFESRGVLTFRVGFPSAMMPDAEIPRRFFNALQPKLAALPGVETVGFTSIAPGLRGDPAQVIIEGQEPLQRGLNRIPVQGRMVSPRYFDAVRIPLKAGRNFDARLDRRDTPGVVLVDQTFALRYFGGEQAAVGKRIRYADEAEKQEWYEIVGVVGAIRHQLDRDEYQSTLYRPLSQVGPAFLTVVMRTHGDPASYVELARETVLSVDATIPIYNELPLDTVLRRTIWPREFFSFLFTMFGLVALLLACVGIYGVMAYNVTQRTQEIGVRMALGAQSAEVVQMVVRRGLRLVGWGLGAGIAAAFVLANLLTSVLYGVSPHDPPTFALVPLLLASVALLACWLPARRATLVNPVEAIRLE